MTFNCVKLGSVTFMKYFSNVFSLILLPKTLTWNKVTFPASSLLNFAELVENRLMKSISKTNLPILFFISNSSQLIVKIFRAYSQRTR